MIEILGVKLTYDTLAWIAAFVASEIIGTSKLKENSVAALAKGMIEVRKASELLRETLRRLGD